MPHRFSANRAEAATVIGMSAIFILHGDPDVSIVLEVELMAGKIPISLRLISRYPWVRPTVIDWSIMLYDFSSGRDPGTNIGSYVS